MRRAWWFLLLVLALFAPMVSASANELKIGDAVVGDVNADGKVDLADVQFALRVAAGLSSLPPERAKVADLAPVGPGGAVGDGRVGITDVAKLLALVLRRTEFRSIHKVVVEEAGMVILQLQNVPDFFEYPLLVVKEDGEQRIACGSHRWNMQGDYLCRFQSKSKDPVGRVVGVFQDGTPIYEEDLSFNYDKEGNFSPLGVCSAVGLQYFPDKEDDQDSLSGSGAKLIFGSLQGKDSFSFLCVNQEKEKEVFMETPWVIPLSLGLDGNHAVALEDGRLAVVVEEFLPEYLSTSVRILVTDQIIGKGFSGLSPWELFAGAQTSEIFLPGLPETHLAPHRVLSEGKIVAATTTIYPERISVWDLDLPLFDYDYQEKATLMVVVDPYSKETSLTAFTPKALEAGVEVQPLGVCTIPREGKVGYGEEKFFVSYLVSTKRGQTAILYPAHLEERLVEITSW